MTQNIPHWIDGKPCDGQSQRSGPVYNPATGKEKARVAYASVEEVDKAVAAARTAFGEWSDTSLTRRTQIMFRFRNLLEEAADELAALISSEHGKTKPDARGEVQRGLETVEFACGISQLLKGDNSSQVSTGVDLTSVREPLGVVACITPFNCPAMVPLWMTPIAIACGNTVVLKPSEKDPSVANRLGELFAQAEWSFSEGFSTTVFPQAMAIGVIHSGTITGKLKGVMQPTTPTGSRTDIRSTPVETCDELSPFSSWEIPQANSTVSSPRCISPRASGFVLPCSPAMVSESSSAASSSRLRKRNMICVRCVSEVSRQPGKAPRAVATAASTSSALAKATRARSPPVAGSNTGPLRPDWPSRYFPSIQWDI